MYSRYMLGKQLSTIFKTLKLVGKYVMAIVLNEIYIIFKTNKRFLLWVS